STTCGGDTGVDCPRDLECSAFGKQARNPNKFENELLCSLTNVTLGVRCVNNGGGSETASFKSAHLTSGIISETDFITNVDAKGKWTAAVTIFGADLYELAATLTDANGDPVFTDALCPNEQNWTINFSTATILQADVTEQTFLDGVPQNTLNLGTCVLTDFISGTYSCQ
ncbi:MAG TPA: hypothetical protein VGL70_22660, partial [Candidatus Binatia bacterium]